jgi:uroporphyrinogen III methyltransferase/synthase
MSERPLKGRTVVVTRTRAQAAELATILSEAGAEVLEFPTIRIVDPEDWGPADTAAARLADYDWVVFTSANAVRAFFARLTGTGADALAGMSVAAVGPATAARLSDRGITPAFVPDDHRAEGVVDGLVERGVGTGSRVLIPRALEARELIPETLRARGAEVDVVPVYRTVLGEGDAAVMTRFGARTVDAVTFTSSSSVRNFVDLLGRDGVPAILDGVLMASIGPVTSETMRSLGLSPAVEAADSTVAGLVRALVARYEAGAT